jgi:hypothetical protein
VLKSVRLQLLIGPVLPMPAPKELIDGLESVQVNTGVGQKSGFQLTFAVSKKSSVTQTMLPAMGLDPGIRVIVVAIVGGSPHVLSDGIITRQEMSPSDKPGGSKLTITGEDLTVLLNVVQWKLPYPAMPMPAIVATLIAKYAMFGIVPVPVPPFLLDVPNPLANIRIQSGCTDLQYIEELARNVGHVFFIEPGPLPGQSFAYWGPEVNLGPVQPALTFNTGTATNVESLSFSYDGLAKAQYLAEVTLPFVRTRIPVPIPDVGVLQPPLAARPAVRLQWRFLKNTAHLNPINVALYGLNKAVGEANQAISGQGKLDVLRYGHVLKARNLVGVRGAGTAYDGLYFVRSVSHEIKRGEYKQSFTLSRDGLLPLSDKVST